MNEFFTTVKVIDGKAIALDSHLEQFVLGFDKLQLKRPTLDLTTLTELLNKYPKGLHRLNVFAKAGGCAQFKISPYKDEGCSNFHLKTYSKPFYEAYPYVKKKDFSQRLNLLQDAKNAGFDDWVFVNHQSFILETTIANLFWIKDDTLFTPSCELELYYGNTLSFVEKIAEQLNLEVKRIKASIHNLDKNNRLYLCNSMKGICQVSELDNIPLSVCDDELLKLNELYMEMALRDSLLTSG